MKIILRKDMENLGNAGDIVDVKDGYGRNYLIPRGFAMRANERNVRDLDFKKRMIKKQIDTEEGKARNLAEKLATLNINIEKKVGQEGKLFGSVTTRDISDSLAREGIEIDRRTIKMKTPIRKSGVYEVEVSLFRDITGTVKIWVVAEDQDVSELREQIAVDEAASEEQEQSDSSDSEDSGDAVETDSEDETQGA